MNDSINQPTLDKLQEQVWTQVRRRGTKSTSDRYKGVFPNFLDFIDADGDIETVMNVSKPTMRNYIEYLNDEEDGRGLAGRTVNVYRASVYRFFKELPDVVDSHGYDIDCSDDNPADNLDIDDWDIGKKTQKGIEMRSDDDVIWFTSDEKETLVEHAPAPEKRNILLIRLLWQTGLRRSEFVDIRLRDVDTDERSIRIKTAKKKETDDDAYRTVWWQPSLDSLMKEYLDVYRMGFPMADESRYLFPGQRKEKLSDEQVNQTIQKAATNAGIQEKIYTDRAGNTRYKFSSHSMRHSHGVQAVKNNMNVRFLQKEMGHSSIETTETYLKILKEDVKEAFRERGPGTE